MESEREGGQGAEESQEPQTQEGEDSKPRQTPAADEVPADLCRETDKAFMLLYTLYHHNNVPSHSPRAPPLSSSPAPRSTGGEGGAVLSEG